MRRRHPIPPLCGVTEVAELLGVAKQNVVKIKDLPEPALYIGYKKKRPLWIESEIIEFNNSRKVPAKTKEDV